MRATLGQYSRQETRIDQTDSEMDEECDEEIFAAAAAEQDG
jgi:hypothetical protein